jgi:hypothetical protein
MSSLWTLEKEVLIVPIEVFIIDRMKIRKGMRIEDQGKTWIIRSIVGGLVMISEKGKPKALRRYVKLQHLEAIPA